MNERVSKDDIRLIRELRAWGQQRMDEIDQQIYDLRQEWKEVRKQTGVGGIADKFEIHRDTVRKVLSRQWEVKDDE